MRKLTIAMAMVFGMNFFSSMISITVPVGFAQESPAPEPEKPDKPGD